MNWQKQSGANKMSAIQFSIFVSIFCLGTWGLIVGGIEEYAKEIFLGMIAPLFIGIGSIFLLSIANQKSPEYVNRVMVKSFIVKMILYAIYFIYIFTFYTFNPMPFVLSFVGYYITLHISEVLFLKSIFN